jgi:hypothetical protein
LALGYEIWHWDTRFWTPDKKMQGLTTLKGDEEKEYKPDRV